MSFIKYYIAVGFLALAAGLLYWFDPANAHIFPPCSFHALTGLYCPGCGTTRAVHYLLHGDLMEALAMNPLMVVSLPILVLLFFRRSWAGRPWVAWTAFVILILYGVLRNINSWPFILLAPK
jgi:hypothetical protein